MTLSIEQLAKLYTFQELDSAMQLRKSIDDKELEEAKKKSELDGVIRALEKGANVHITLFYGEDMAYFKMNVDGMEVKVYPKLHLDRMESLHQFRFLYKGVAQNTPPADSEDPTYYS